MIIRYQQRALLLFHSASWGGRGRRFKSCIPDLVLARKGVLEKLYCTTLYNFCYDSPHGGLLWASFVGV